MWLANAYRRAIVLLVRALTFVYVRRYEVVGREHVPATGPLIVASNHLNNADPPMLARAIVRYPVFMAKKEIIDAPVIGHAFRAWGAFPVRRGAADLASLRRAGEILRSGRVLMMFPEGTRSRTGGLGPGHPGTAMIALHGGVPILPVAITGTEGVRWPWFFFWPRSVRHVRIVIGEPFVLPPVKRIDRETASRATEIIMRRIAELLPPGYRGVYAETQQPASAAG